MDPYGVKSLDFAHFARLKQVGFRSLEMLINLNSTGFLREGCRLLKLDRDVPDWADDADYDADGRNTVPRMDQVVGGTYWQEILSRFQDGRIDFHQAEEDFIAGYTGALHGLFKFAINIPIKERSRHMPKYRLVFATDHHEGLFLMANEMNTAWRNLLAQETGAQLYLFDDRQLAALNGGTIEDKLMAELAVPLELRELLVRMIGRHGIAHTTAEYKKAIKDAEGTLFSITREPPTTPTGRKSTSMDHDNFKITVAARPHTPTLLNW